VHSLNSQVASAALSPTRAVAILRRVAGPIWKWVGVIGVLKVSGRRTGNPLHVALMPVEVEGTWYLVSFGGVTDWVRNLRAARHGELRRKGRAEAFTAVEVDGNERERVIAAYLARLGPIKRNLDPVKRDFDRRPGAPDHPAFRMEPIR
jgi:deazaflavin-dependent oxidoreductase (nitroreductase family)